MDYLKVMSAVKQICESHNLPTNINVGGDAYAVNNMNDNWVIVLNFYLEEENDMVECETNFVFNFVSRVPLGDKTYTTDFLVQIPKAISGDLFKAVYAIHSSLIKFNWETCKL